jgi:hypothetical protein
MPATAKSIANKNPRHLIRSTGHNHGGWLPDRPNGEQDWRLERKLGDAIRAAVPENPFLDPATYPKIRNQGQQGSCTGHGVRNVLMQRLLSRDHPLWSKYDLSPASAYLNGREIDGSVNEDAGSYIRSVVKGAAAKGVTREDFAPYNDRRLTTQLSAKAVEGAKWHQALHYYRCDVVGASTETTVDNIIRALAAGLPVIFGFTCFSNLGFADADGFIRLPGPNDHEDGGHCMSIYEADTRNRKFYWPEFLGRMGCKRSMWSTWLLRHAI